MVQLLGRGTGCQSLQWALIPELLAPPVSGQPEEPEQPQQEPSKGGERGATAEDSPPELVLGRRPSPCWPFPPQAPLGAAASSTGPSINGRGSSQKSAVSTPVMNSLKRPPRPVQAASSISRGDRCPAPQREDLQGSLILTAFRHLGEAGCSLPALLASIPSGSRSDQAEVEANFSYSGISNYMNLPARPCFFKGCQFTTRLRQPDGSITDAKENHVMCSGCKVASFCCTQCQAMAMQAHGVVECELLKALKLVGSNS